jgi:Uma2 family endonuclease
MTTTSTPVQRQSLDDVEEAVPPLQAFDHLDQPTFHKRYAAMPKSVRAELIGGVVHMASPVKPNHGDVHGELVTWLTLYKAATQGTRALDDTTQILGEDSEPQPDASLLIIGGQTRLGEDGYLYGAPEFAAEVALSTESYDLHSKKRDYERYGVREYLVMMVRLKRAAWFVRENDKFVEMPPGPDGIYRSPLMKGLWLDPAAMLRLDTNRVVEVLNQGLASPEHAEFVKSLQQPM